jgi:fructan beta-fructosidase
MKLKKLWPFCLAISCLQVNAQEAGQRITITKRYLNFPVTNADARHPLTLKENGTELRTFNIRISENKPDYWVGADMKDFKGKTISLSYPATPNGLKSVYQSDELPGADSVYKEVNRPQFHFTTKIGWNNDPNGMVFYKGEYHLFYQHNPYEVNWENMHWGHAVSRDLLHWDELGEALYPDSLGAMFSGSAVVDFNNTAGFQKGNEKTLVAIYTTHKEGAEVQCVAYSNDAGRSWTKYKGNPVINSTAKWNSGNTRDPKVFWHEPSKKWVMALFEKDGHSFYNSDDLKKWTFLSHIGGFWECPEFFQLPVDGNPKNKKWVLYGMSGTYMIGDFDGKSFKPTTEKLKYYEGPQMAPQTFNNIPDADGRRIQIGWGSIVQPGMPFNQMMMFPTQLTLKTTRGGVRLYSEPIRELKQLHKKSHQWSNLTAEQANANTKAVSGDLFHVKMKIQITDGTVFDIKYRGNSIAHYDMNHNKLNGVFYPGNDFEKLTMDLELLIDKTSLELFADDGKFTIIRQMEVPKNTQGFEFGGNIKIHSLEIHELSSIWTK